MSKLNENEVNNKYHCLMLNLEDNGLVKKNNFFHKLQQVLNMDDIYSVYPVETYVAELHDENDNVLERKSFNHNGSDDEEFGYENHPHVTVCYGFVDDQDFFKLSEWGIKPFTIKLTNVSAFRKENCPRDVLLIEVESDYLHELNARIRKEFNIVTTYPDYHPHVTLAYIKKGTCENIIGLEINKEFLINKLEFSTTDGLKLLLTLI